MSENTITQSDFDSFISRFSDYLAKANESKKRGNNDYNPLKAVQKLYDEVNMHSGFIYSLLDTNGEHYQDDLFLSLFLEVLGLNVWFGSTTNAQVRKESNYIDLYIFNDTKHIIIENKINADDQPNQIATLIETIHNNGAENKRVEYENIFVIFLTLHDREPSQNSRTNKDNNLLWEIKGDFLESKEGEKINRVGYKKVLYENEILKWIESCQSKSGVGNITNLNYALESYKDIVQIITGEKESTMSIADFFKKAEDFEMAFEIHRNFGKIKKQCAEVRKQALKENPFSEASSLKNKLQEEKYKDWEILVGEKECEKFRSSPDAQLWKNVVVYNKRYEESEQTFRYMFESELSTCFGVRLAMRKSDDYINFVDIGEHPKFADKIAKNIREVIFKNSNLANIKFCKNDWWFYGWLNFEDFTPLRDYFLENYEKVNKVNEWLKEQEFNNPNSEIAKLAKEVKDYQIDS